MRHGFAKLEKPSLSLFPSVKSSVSLLPFTGVLQEIPCEVTRKVGFAALNGKRVASFGRRGDLRRPGKG